MRTPDSIVGPDLLGRHCGGSHIYSCENLPLAELELTEWTACSRLGYKWTYLGKCNVKDNGAVVSESQAAWALVAFLQLYWSPFPPPLVRIPRQLITSIMLKLTKAESNLLRFSKFQALLLTKRPPPNPDINSSSWPRTSLPQVTPPTAHEERLNRKFALSEIFISFKGFTLITGLALHWTGT